MSNLNRRTNAVATNNFVKTIFNLLSVSNTWQYYHIPASNIASIAYARTISFVADYGSVGSAKTGTIDVVVHGLTYEPIIYIDPGSATNVTWLKDGPFVSGIDTTEVAQLSTTNFIVYYNLSTNGIGSTGHGAADWDAAMVSWGYSGTNVVFKNLSEYTSFVFAVRGTANSVKVEFQSKTNASTTNLVKAIAVLRSVTNTWQYYNIPASFIDTNTGSGNLQFMQSITFVAVYADVGTVKTGQFEVVVRGLTYYPPLGPTNGPATVLPNQPRVIPVGGANPNTVVMNTTNVIDVTYNVTNGWSGASIQYGTQGTNDSQNLSAYTNLVFGLWGGAKKVKIELLDAFTNKAIFICTNVGATVTNYYSIDTTRIRSFANTDITNISMISFVVDKDLVTPTGNLVGNFHILSGGLYVDWYVGPSNAGPATILPNSPQVIPVGGANTNTVVVNSTNVIDVNYDLLTSGGGWSGATILYDNYGTPGTKESQDLSFTNNLVFGLWGNAKNVKIEFLDAFNKKSIVTCTNVTSSKQYYWINTARINTNADITRISSISFVVDSNLVTGGSGDPSGWFHVESGGLAIHYPDIAPTSMVSLTLLPPTPLDVIPVGGAAPGTRVEQYDSGHFRVYYSITSSTNWSGASILYDDFGTETTEVGNFSTLTSVVFAVAGRLNGMKIEFEDSSPSTIRCPPICCLSANLNSSTRSMWRFCRTNGLKVDSVKLISFVVDSNLVGAANMSGYFDVYTLGLTNSLKIYPWWQKYGLAPTDWPNGDPDGDGADNLTEYIAGTNPTNVDSAPIVNIATSGKTNALVSIGGFDKREYRFYRTDNLRTGTWSRVWQFNSSNEASVQYADDMAIFSNMFYRCSILYKNDVTRLGGQPNLRYDSERWRCHRGLRQEIL